MIQVGDKITRKIKVYDASAQKLIATTMQTTVVFVHPQTRFYVVRCDMPGNRRFRETLYFRPRCGSM